MNANTLGGQRANCCQAEAKLRPENSESRTTSSNMLEMVARVLLRVRFIDRPYDDKVGPDVNTYCECRGCKLHPLLVNREVHPLRSFAVATFAVRALGGAP